MQVDGVLPNQPGRDYFTLLSASIMDEADKVMKMILEQKLIAMKMVISLLNSMKAEASMLALDPRHSQVEKHVEAFAGAANKLCGMSATDPGYNQAHDSLKQAFDQLKEAS